MRKLGAVVLMSLLTTNLHAFPNIQGRWRGANGNFQYKNTSTLCEGLELDVYQDGENLVIPPRVFFCGGKIISHDVIEARVVGDKIFDKNGSVSGAVQANQLLMYRPVGPGEDPRFLNARIAFPLNEENGVPRTLFWVEFYPDANGERMTYTSALQRQ